ncbi:MAG TPA: PQQ-binding-like beta-propeller repeat protein, partial [Chloroflexota bacterium]
KKKGSSMKRLYAAIAVIAVAVTVYVPRLSSAQTAQPWPTFHGNQTRNGATTLSGPTSGTALNEWTVSAPVQSSPAVDAAGTAYIGDNNGYVYAFNPSKPSGPLWSFKTGAALKANANVAVKSSPTLSADGKTLFVGSDDGSVYALNTADGTKKWSVDLGGPVDGSPLLSPDGTVIYAANVNGILTALHSSDGSFAWQVKTVYIGSAITGSVTLSPDGGTLYVATYIGVLYGIPVSANQAGSPTAYYLDGPAVTTPAVDQAGNIYVATQKGSVMSFNPGTVQPRWTFTVPNLTPALSTPAISGNTVVFGDGNQNVYGLNASNGQQIWIAHTGGPVGSSPAISGNNMVYVGSDDGTVYALRLDTGSSVWVRASGAAVSSSPAIGADGSLWVANTLSTGGKVDRINVLTPPGTPIAGATAVPTATKGPTATAQTTATVSPTPTPTGGTIAISLKASVKDGQKQTIKITTTPNTLVHIRVQYPNGDHQSHGQKTNASGKLTYSYTQGASKIKHNQFVATVTAKTDAPNAKQGSSRYKILFGNIDVSVEPRSAKVNQVVSIYIHTAVGKKVVAYLLYPSGKFVTRYGVTGPHGFAHMRYQIPSNMVSGSKRTVVVLAKYQSGRPPWSTRSTLKIK